MKIPKIKFDWCIDTKLFKINVQFNRLFMLVKEGDYIKPTIVAFNRIPYEVEWDEVVGRVVKSYDYMIYLNLYLIELKFNFIW